MGAHTNMAEPKKWKLDKITPTLVEDTVANSQETSEQKSEGIQPLPPTGGERREIPGPIPCGAQEVRYLATVHAAGLILRTARSISQLAEEGLDWVEALEAAQLRRWQRRRNS